MKEMVKQVILVLLGALAAFGGQHVDAYEYAVQRLYHPKLNMTVDLIHEYHDDISGVDQIRKELVQGFCDLDKKSPEHINVLWEYADSYWAPCHKNTSGHCMIPAGYTLRRKLKHALSFVEADTLRHSPRLCVYDDFMCQKWDDAEGEECLLDDILTQTDDKKIKEVLNAACDFIDELCADNGARSLYGIDSIAYKPAKNYAKKTFQECKNRLAKCRHKAKSATTKKAREEIIVALKDDLFDLVPDLEFFSKLWQSPTNHSIVYAGGSHCRSLADELIELGFKEKKALQLKEHSAQCQPKVLSSKKLFSFLSK